MHVSDQQRQTLLHWLDQAAQAIPTQFSQTIANLNNLQTALSQVDDELAMVPSDEVLEPLVKSLHVYNQQLGQHQQAEKDLTETINTLNKKLERITRRLEIAREEIIEAQQDDDRIQLAINTHRALNEYATQLRQEKLLHLEGVLLKQFNLLNRKKGLVDAIKIDPLSFKITLYRQNQPFARQQLSAGEKQLLAVAIMWSLRLVSGWPMPVILDTPLGRLDSDHRLNLLQNYFPHASHQVILLATDTEIDDDMVSYLEPAISQTYNLSTDLNHHQVYVSNSRYVQPSLFNGD